MATPAVSQRDVFARMYRSLMFGVVGVWLAAAGLTVTGIAPLMPDNDIPEFIPAALCVLVLLAAWLWARPRVPLRSRAVSVEAYWQNPLAATTGALLAFMLEGAATLAAVWTMISGSWLTALVSLVCVVGLVFSGPGHQEQRFGQDL